MTRKFTVLVVLAAATVCAQIPAQGVVKSKSNITNNIVTEADGRLRCLTPNGKACSAQDLQELMAAINNSHSNIKNLALTAPDGTIRCQTAEGKACTAAHASELNAAIRHNYDLKQSKAGRAADNSASANSSRTPGSGSTPTTWPRHWGPYDLGLSRSSR